MTRPTITLEEAIAKRDLRNSPPGKRLRAAFAAMDRLGRDVVTAEDIDEQVGREAEDKALTSSFEGAAKVEVVG